VALSKNVLLKPDTHCKMKAWIKNLNARNAGAKNESKADSTTKSSGIANVAYMAVIFLNSNN